jgi:KDO2-lipid IV(A) lauroyltransferase
VGAAVAEGLGGGRGLLILTAHIGNFELLARIFGTAVAPVAVFHRPLGIPEVDGFLIRERQRCGVATLGRGTVVRAAMRILAAGGCVAVPLDQNQREGRGIFVDVLGHPASTSTLLARLSVASGAPVLPVFAVWKGQTTMPVIGELIAPPSPHPGIGGRDAVLRALTERYSAEIDRVVRRFPHQWNWAHRRWKTRPAASAQAQSLSPPVPPHRIPQL